MNLQLVQTCACLLVFLLLGRSTFCVLYNTKLYQTVSGWGKIQVLVKVILHYLSRPDFVSNQQHIVLSFKISFKMFFISNQKKSSQNKSSPPLFFSVSFFFNCFISTLRMWMFYYSCEWVFSVKGWSEYSDKEMKAS